MYVHLEIFFLARFFNSFFSFLFLCSFFFLTLTDSPTYALCQPLALAANYRRNFLSYSNKITITVKFHLSSAIVA
jgi:hypothetical protein